MKRTQVYLPDDLYEEAKLVARITDTNISQLMRNGLQIALANSHKTRRKENSLLKHAGMFSDGPPDASERHNDIYSVAVPLDDTID